MGTASVSATVVGRAGRRRPVRAARIAPIPSRSRAIPRTSGFESAPVRASRVTAAPAALTAVADPEAARAVVAEPLAGRAAVAGAGEADVGAGLPAAVPGAGAPGAVGRAGSVGSGAPAADCGTTKLRTSLVPTAVPSASVCTARIDVVPAGRGFAGTRLHVPSAATSATPRTLPAESRTVIVAPGSPVPVMVGRLPART